MVKKWNSLCFVFFVTILVCVVTLGNPTWNSSLTQVYGHSFTPNSLASFISAADQFQTEVNLLENSIINENNITLAQKHANEANSIFYWELMGEISERDKKVSDELKSAVDDLLNISSSSSDTGINSTSTMFEISSKQIQQMKLLVAKINADVNSILNTTISQNETKEDSNILNQVISFLSLFFMGQESVTTQSIQSMRFVELLDDLLRNYGDAFAVKYDMTDMSNMANMNNRSNLKDHNRMNMETKENYENITDITDYQSAKGLVERLAKIFDNEIKPLMEKNEMSNYSNNIEKGLTQLQNSIEDKAPPMDIMMIVHTQIHPNLIEAFDLQII